MPNIITPCPSAADMANPQSLAATCHVTCPKTSAATTSNSTSVMSPPKSSRIPVSPLPGEALGDVQPQLQSVGSTTPPESPIPVVGQIGSMTNEMIPPSLPVQQPVIQNQPVSYKQPVIGEAASLGTKISGAAWAASPYTYSISAPFLALSVTFLVQLLL